MNLRIYVDFNFFSFFFNVRSSSPKFVSLFYFYIFCVRAHARKKNIIRTTLKESTHSSLTEN